MTRDRNQGEGAAGGSPALWRAAARLGLRLRAQRRARQAPAIFFFTDPTRTPAPENVLLALPRGAGVVYRGFGRIEAAAEARRLVVLGRRRGLVVLVGADARLAAAAGAAGVHLPERALMQARRLRQARPAWILTGAAHTPLALARAGRLPLDAVFYSTAFPSRSPSAARRAVGPLRLALLFRALGVRTHALGGVSAATLPRLAATGISGFGAVEAFLGAAAES